MTQQFEHLFKPIQLGPLTIPNRICFSAHMTLFAENNLPSRRQVYYYAERAKGGVGLIVVGGSFTHETSNWFAGDLRVDNEAAISGYRRITDAVHEHGTKILSQCWHWGREMASVRSRRAMWAPSPFSDPMELETPKEMEIEDIEELIEAKGRSARVIREGGFDGVELLAAQGLLMNQFLSPYTNQRTDEWGGSLENRCRYAVRVMERVRREIGRELCLGIKLVGDEFTPTGLTLKDTQEIAKHLAATGLLDYIHVCAGTLYSLPVIVPEMSFPAGFAAYLAAGIREVVNIPIIAIKRINDPALAEKILAEGQADMVAMARALIADPELPKKAREGRLEDIRQCTASNQDCVGRVLAGHPLSCVHNPTVGEEERWGTGTFQPAVRKKKVIVVGGGPGGLKVAEIAAQRGHEVHLYEKGSELGGQVLSMTKVKSRGDWGSVVRYLTIQMRKLEVKVHLGREMKAEAVLAEGADTVVLATGSTPLKTGYTSARPEVSRLPGIEQDNVLTVFDVFQDGKGVGRRVLIIDEFGDFEATMTAEYLADQGRQVEIVTRLPYVGMKIEPSSIDPQMERLAERKVICTPLTMVKEINGMTVVGNHVYTKEERQFEGVDTVVLVMGKRANQDLYFALKGKVAELHRVGDCVAPRKITDAIYDGNLVGREI